MRELNIKSMPELPFNVSEALNQLRVNLGFCGQEIKTIMITSSTPNEGKSFIAINLWKMMADMGVRTLLIDCDLRNSSFRTKYGISGDKITGIAHYLAGKVELQDALYSTNIPNGFMIPLATIVANPSILLEGPRFKLMLEACEKVFDYIIIDTPPLGNVADALNITNYCDGTLLVVRSGVVPRKMVENSIQLLKRTDTRLLGMVLNRVDMSKKTNSYYYNYYNRYYHYSSYYSGSYGYGNNKKE